MRCKNATGQKSILQPNRVFAISKEGVFAMPKAVTYGKTERMSFARHEEIQSMPNLLELSLIHI